MEEYKVGVSQVILYNENPEKPLTMVTKRRSKLAWQVKRYKERLAREALEPCSSPDRSPYRNLPIWLLGRRSGPVMDWAG